MFCQKCGTEIELDAEFLYNSEFSCPKCGNAIKSATIVKNENYIEPKSPWEYFIGAFKKYAVFKGRARRAEYWWFFLFYTVFSIVAPFLDSILNSYILGNTGIFELIWTLGSFLPTLSITIRRIHDSDRSGWFYLVPIYSVILLFFNGTDGENRFGPDPKKKPNFVLNEKYQ